jgi:hypothetical protein
VKLSHYRQLEEYHEVLLISRAQMILEGLKYGGLG